MKESNFESRLRDDLTGYLLSQGLLDEQLPQCPDVEDKWKEIGEEYLPDGIREFSDFPIVSLGWMMFLGMAIANYWDSDWADYGSREHLYVAIRDARGYDRMDEYILEDVLRLDAVARGRLSAAVGECASRVDGMLRREPLEPGSPEAFRAYIYSLRQLYAIGMAMELKRLGYRMAPLN